jgi:hypothetical protein
VAKSMFGIEVLPMHHDGSLLVLVVYSISHLFFLFPVSTNADHYPCNNQHISGCPWNSIKV